MASTPFICLKDRGNLIMEEQKNGRASALLPILVFLLIFLGSGLLTGDFYSMPAIVAFLIALFVAFIQNRSLSFADRACASG